MHKIRLGNGVTVRTFRLPPAGFNPLDASDKVLAFHGFPRRPKEDAALLEHWEKVFSRPLQYIQPEFRELKYKQHGVMKRRRRVTHGSETSDIWSGAVVYAPANTSISWVQGEWTVPNTSPPNGAANASWYSASTWIGIDGDGSSDVLQAGCDSDVISSGGTVQRQLTPWWEWYPGGTYWISNFPVSQGDTLSCLICAQLSTRAASIFLMNDTSGVHASFQVTPPKGTSLSGNCAEWIVEALRIDSKDPELASYGDVYFNAANAGAKDGTLLQAGSGNTISITDKSGSVISSGNIENSRLVRCSFEALP